MPLTPCRPAAFLAAITASALSLAIALVPMTSRAAPTLDTALAACTAAWIAQGAKVQDVRFDRMTDAGGKLKLSLRAKDAAKDGAGAKLKTRCVLNAKGDVLSIGSAPITQLASGAR